MSEKVREQVEQPHAHDEIRTARNLPDAANAGQSLQGYAAINNVDDDSEIAQVAYDFFQTRERDCVDGCADDDWFRAEQEVRRKREATNA